MWLSCIITTTITTLQNYFKNDWPISDRIYSKFLTVFDLFHFACCCCWYRWWWWWNLKSNWCTAAAAAETPIPKRKKLFTHKSNEKLPSIWNWFVVLWHIESGRERSERVIMFSWRLRWRLCGREEVVNTSLCDMLKFSIWI